MHRQTLSCPVCLIEYDQGCHLPKIIVACGHTICLECLTTILRNPNDPKCPLDNIIFLQGDRMIYDFPSNYLAMHLIAETQVENNCTEHHEKKRLACFTDRSQICDDCVHFGQHKGHEIKPLKVIRPHLETKTQQLSTALEAVDEHCRQVDRVIAQMQISIENTIKFRFKELEQIIKKKELELLAEAKSFIDHQREQVINSFGRDSPLRQELVKKISDYKQLFDHEDFFYLIEENLDIIIFKVDKEILSSNAQDLERELEVSISALDDILLSKSLSIFELGLPNQKLSKPYVKYFENYTQEPFKIKPESTYDFKCKTNLLFDKKESTLIISTNEKDTREIAIQTKQLDDIAKVVINIDPLPLSTHDSVALLYIWRHLKKSISLELISEAREITNTALTNVLSTIPYIAGNLSNFTIKLLFTKNINDDTIAPFLEKTLPNMKKLKHLHLGFLGTDITDQSIIFLSNRNRELIKSLLTLEINIGETRVTDAGLAPMFFMMPLMETFYLNTYKTSITDISIEAFTRRSLPSMKNLKSFELYVSGTKATDRHIILPASIRSIKKLGLGFGHVDVTEDFLMRLGRDYLQSLSQVENLLLRLYNTKVGDKEIAHLYVPLRTVKRFSLSMNNTRITDRSIEVLTAVTLSSMDTLEHLDLSFDGTLITDEGALKLFINSRKLKKLKIGLSNTKVTDKFGEEFLNRLLPSMECLEDFDIYLGYTNMSVGVINRINVARLSLVNSKKGV